MGCTQSKSTSGAVCTTSDGLSKGKFVVTVLLQWAYSFALQHTEPSIIHHMYIVQKAGRPSTPTSPAANKALAADNNSPSPKISPGVIQGSPTKSDLSVISPLPTNNNSNPMTGSHTSSSNRSNTPTPSLDGSQSSTTSRKRMLRNSTSALGLDKMIDEKRDAKTMSERVVHIEVCYIYLVFAVVC